MPFYPVVAAHYWDGSDYRPVEYLGDPTPPTLAPTTPTGLDYLPFTNRLDVTWNPSTPGTGDGIDFYRVFVNGSLVAQPGPAAVSLTGLSPATNYGIRVQAVSDKGLVSLLSAELLASTLGLPAVTTMFGWHAKGNNGNYAAYTTPMGIPNVYRYYKSGGALTNFPIGGGIGSTVPIFYSWKPVLATLLAGGYDAALASFFASCPTNRPTWFCTWHEMDVKSMNAAEFKSMFNYVGAKIRNQPNQQIKSTMCIGGWKQGSQQSQYFPDPGLIDVYAADPYTEWTDGRGGAWSRATYAGGRAVMHRYLFDHAAAFVPSSVQLGIGEVGIVAGSSQRAGSESTDAQRAAWCQGVIDISKEEGLGPVCYFNGDGGVPDTSLLQSPQAMAVWKTAVTA